MIGSFEENFYVNTMYQRIIATSPVQSLVELVSYNKERVCINSDNKNKWENEEVNHIIEKSVKSP